MPFQIRAYSKDFSICILSPQQPFSVTFGNWFSHGRQSQDDANDEYNDYYDGRSPYVYRQQEAAQQVHNYTFKSFARDLLNQLTFSQLRRGY